LDTDKFELRSTAAVILQTQLDHLADTLHQSVQILGLGMATNQSGHRSDEITVLIPLDDDCEFARRFHKAILARTVRPQSFCMFEKS
jgi:hypothetical protein